MRYVPSVDDRERARLVEDNVELARKAAGVIYPRVRAHVTFDEVVSLANAGLAEAAARFDPDRGVAFTTFAWYRCYGAIMDGLRRAANLPRRDWAKLVALRGAAAYLEQRGERELGARATGAPPPDSREALLAIRSALDAIKTIYLTSLETLVDREAEPAVDHQLPERIDTVRMGRRIRIAIRDLPERERELLKKHYFEGKDLDEAGSELGISKSWASRLHARAVERLRAAIGGEEDTA